MTVDDRERPGAATDRSSAAYISRYQHRTPPLRAIRLKCCECMGGDPFTTPRGEVARAIDECSSVACALWAFRYGKDPWRPAPSEEQREAARARLAALRQSESRAAEQTGAEGGDDDA